MNARVVSPMQGLRWIFEGLRTFMSAPVGWFALAFGYLIISMVLSVIPVVGALSGLILYPAFTVGFMVASRARALRQPVELPMLFAGFRERVPQLVILGGAYVIGIALALLGSSLADDGILLGMFTAAPAAGETRTIPAEVRNGVLLAMALYVPTFMMMFFSPLLVAWHAMPPLKSLFYSFFACLLNWRAFAAYLSVGILLMLVTANLVLILALALVGAEARSNANLLLAVMAPLMLVLVWPVMMGSVYASYRDIFGAPGGG
ncbi:MAG: BPSS1780 family membrane protein [Betaproteobacteria bacterium]|nr:BPSS1780 family membrane protein [Betaproteobacteria bacterium]MDH5211135.1 BPSS1780 family membrane protein [Betaproteobacteria bacterium]